MSDCTTTVIRAHIAVDNSEHVLKAWEVLQRTVLGLGLDGIHASVHIERYEHDDHEHDHEEDEQEGAGR